MKKYVIATAVAAAAFAPQAFAQAKNFEGFSVLGAVNVNSTKAEVTVTTPAATASDSKTTTNVGVQAEYGWALGNDFVLGAGVTVGLSDLDLGSGAKIKNTVGLYVAPGFAVSKDSLVYAKLGSTSASVDIPGLSFDVSGMAYGIGFRSFTSKNVFFQGEYTYNKYDDKNFVNGKITATTGVLSLGVGYKF